MSMWCFFSRETMPCTSVCMVLCMILWISLAFSTGARKLRWGIRYPGQHIRSINQLEGCELAPISNTSSYNHQGHPHKRRCRAGCRAWGQRYNCVKSRRPTTGRRTGDSKGLLQFHHNLHHSDCYIMTVYITQIDCLPEIVEAVQGRVEVYMDGGIRTGSDVLKAVALGAKCVFIGRPAIWGLAYKVTLQESGFFKVSCWYKKCCEHLHGG